MTKYLCLSCNKEATPTTNHDPNSAIVYYFAECCMDNSYPHLECFNPQAEDKSL